jgi:hypothetical protein
MASPDPAQEILFQSKTYLDCWINARRRDEHPGDSAGRFAEWFCGDLKVVILSAPALYFPTPPKRS